MYIRTFMHAYACHTCWPLVMLHNSCLNQCSERVAAAMEGEMIRSFWCVSQEGSPLDRPTVHGSQCRTHLPSSSD